MDSQIVGSPYKEDPNMKPLIWETPDKKTQNVIRVIRNFFEQTPDPKP